MSNDFSPVLKVVLCAAGTAACFPLSFAAGSKILAACGHGSVYSITVAKAYKGLASAAAVVGATIGFCTEPRRSDSNDDSNLSSDLTIPLAINVGLGALGANSMGMSAAQGAAAAATGYGAVSAGMLGVLMGGLIVGESLYLFKKTVEGCVNCIRVNHDGGYQQVSTMAEFGIEFGRELDLAEAGVDAIIAMGFEEAQRELDTIIRDNQRRMRADIAARSPVVRQPGTLTHAERAAAVIAENQQAAASAAAAAGAQEAGGAAASAAAAAGAQEAGGAAASAAAAAVAQEAGGATAAAGEEKKECIICMEKITADNRPAPPHMFPCNHGGHYHQTCIERWNTSGVGSGCPECRVNLDESDIPSAGV